MEMKGSRIFIRHPVQGGGETSEEIQSLHSCINNQYGANIEML